MKHLTLYILVAITLLSCVKEEGLLQNLSNLKGNAIFKIYDNFEKNAATRGEINDKNKLGLSGDFHLAMINSGSNIHHIDPKSGRVIYKMGTNKWVSEFKVWNETDVCDFYAYYPKANQNDVLTTTFNKGQSSRNLLTYDMPAEPLEHLDILLAKAENKRYSDGEIDLHFNHITSGLKFSIMKKSDGSSKDIEVKKIEIQGLKTKATYSTDGVWTNDGTTSTNIVYDAGEELLLKTDYLAPDSHGIQNITKANGAMFFPQQTEADLRDLKIIITLTDSHGDNVLEFGGSKDYTKGLKSL